jgi:hypothetical protein
VAFQERDAMVLSAELGGNPLKKYLGILAAGVIVTAGFSTPGVASRFAQVETITEECTDDLGQFHGTTTYVGPTELWPPNHKYVPATITWTDEDAGDEVMVDFMAGHDQFLPDGEEINGAGNTDNDITPAMGAPTETGEVVQEFQIRSERSGRVQEGRNYTISGVVTFGNNNVADPEPATSQTCEFSFTIHVPHDQGNGNGKL